MCPEIRAAHRSPVIDYDRHLRDDGVAIFLFHGVIREQRHLLRNYTRKHLPVAEFQDVIDDLVAHGTPVSMPDVAEALTGGDSLPPRAFAITFDDGFENNLSVAAPILQRASVPATFYVTTGFIESNGRSWIDRIEAAVEASPVAVVDLPSLPLRMVCRELAEKRALLDRIRSIVKSRPDLDPYGVAADVEAQLDSRELKPDGELDAKLTWTGLRTLHKDPLFTIGGHGHTHKVLSFLSPQELRDEITHSLDILERELSEPLRHYSYPEGLSHCYSDRVIDELRQSGIICAPTAEPGVNRPGDDPFRLKRIMVS